MGRPGIAGGGAPAQPLVPPAQPLEPRARQNPQPRRGDPFGVRSARGSALLHPWLLPDAPFGATPDPHSTGLNSRQAFSARREANGRRAYTPGSSRTDHVRSSRNALSSSATGAG